MEQINKQSLIGEILELDSGTASFLMEMGMHCIGCPASLGESLEEACFVHGVDVEEMVTKINEYLASRQ